MGEAHKAPARLVKLSVPLLLLLSLLCVLAASARLSRAITTPAMATASLSMTLTARHGEEVKFAIERYETNWLSFEAHLNPGLQTRYATGYHLEYWGFARIGSGILNEPFWLVTRSAMVSRLRLLEYSEDRFKAIALAASTVDKLTLDGGLIETLPPQKTCRLYVFLNEDNVWKAVAVFDATDTRNVDRDWDAAAEAIHRHIVDLPADITRYCEQ